MTNKTFQKVWKKADRAGVNYQSKVQSCDGTGEASAYGRGYTESVYSTGRKVGFTSGVITAVITATVVGNSEKIVEAAKKGWTCLKGAFKDKTEKEDDEIILDSGFDELS